MLAATPLCRQGVVGALADQLALEVGQRGEDMHDEPAGADVVSMDSARLLKPTPRSASS